MNTIEHHQICELPDDFTLKHGNHSTPDDGMCLMEAIIKEIDSDYLYPLARRR